jgi:hypothetical protein
MHTNNRIAVVYIYDASHCNSASNFSDFQKDAIIDRVDYFISGLDTAKTQPQFENQNIFITPQSNGLTERNQLANAYKLFLKDSPYDFIFIVSSRVKVTTKFRHTKENWVSKFIEKFTPEVHLVGSRIIILPAKHPLAKLGNEKFNKKGVLPYVPTSAFGVTKTALDFLASEKFFESDSCVEHELQKLDYDISLSQKILNNQWNISAVLDGYSEHDYRQLREDFNKTSCHGDPAFEGCYFGRDLLDSNPIFYETQTFDRSKSTKKSIGNATVKLYGIVYNEDTRRNLCQGFVALDNSDGPKELYEVFPIFRQLLREDLQQNSWTGFFSPKFFEKTKISVLDIHAEVNSAGKNDEVILFSSHWDQAAYWPNVWRQGEYFHPGTLNISKRIAKASGYQIDLENVFTGLESAVYSNYFIAKPNFWHEWARLVSIYFDLMREDPNLRYARTLYQNELVLIHTFVLERIPSMIILENNLKTKYNPQLYDKSISHRSVHGHESIEMDYFKSKYSETKNEFYLSFYKYYVDSFNKRQRVNLLKRQANKFDRKSRPATLLC